jgi:hypothetical protein
VLTAHDQAFERSYPLTGLVDTRVAAPKVMSTALSCYQDTGNGVIYLKVSPSGKLSNQNGSFSVFKHATKPAWTAVRDNTAHHFTQGQVTATSLTMTTYNVGATGAPAVVDRFTISKSSCTGTPTPTTLRFSYQADRSGPVALNGATVSGPVYVFTAPDRATTTRVRFYVDDIGRVRSPYRTESNPPYDLGGGSVTAASPFQTTSLTNGSHTLTAVVDDSASTAEVVTATFTVAN